MYALVTSKSLSGIFLKWKHCFVGGRITSSSLSKSKAQEEYGDLEEERNEQTNKNLLLIGFYIFMLSCTYWIEYPIGKLYYSVALCWLMWTYVHEKMGWTNQLIFPDQPGLHGLDMLGDGVNGGSVMLKSLDGNAIVVDFVGFMFGEFWWDWVIIIFIGRYLKEFTPWNDWWSVHSQHLSCWKGPK